MRPIIRIENLGKQYRLGGRRASYQTLRESLTEAATAPLRWLRGERPADANTIWALRDVNLEVKPGEVVGIIGRNGAGKSTLLKVLSRITEPTTGQVELYGRVGSLLEVGTGFHPELTGRENIYLNGAILGMKRREIDRQFDEIVAFAEVEQFLDTPVKHYSSGMYMRLAFAVAAHLEPEILLIDEVLSVGDAAFQKRCIGKMGDVARAGRTVLFVSHQLGSLANLCDRAVLLVQGTKFTEGPTAHVIAEYLAMGRDSQGERIWRDRATAPGNDKVRLHAVRIRSAGEVTADVDIQNDVWVEVEFWNLKPETRLSASIHLLDKMGTVVLASGNGHSANLIRDDWFGQPHPVGRFVTTCTLPGNFLNEGRYSINVFLLTEVTNVELSVPEAVSFTVHDTGAMRAEYGGGWIGAIRPRLAWQTEYLEAANGTVPADLEARR